MLFFSPKLSSPSQTGVVVQGSIILFNGSFLNMNASETKEMFIDFSETSVVPVLGHQLDVLKKENDLETVFDDKL